jgi:penicillin-insensitive murein endopeptidase
VLRSRALVPLLLAVASAAGCSREASLLEARPATIVAPQTIALAPPPPPFREPYFPFLAEEDATRSVSVGDTSDGYLVNASAILPGPHLRVLPRQRARELAFATDEMAALLERAGQDVFGRTGRPLWLGNVARRGGGDIRWSISHNDGRDADIAFAYVDLSGAPTDPPDLARVDAEGLASAESLRFDAAGTWTIVRALLDAAQGSVQYLFVAAPLRRKLLAHARAAGEPARRLAHAEDVLVEPAGAPHDDHLHLRIYCSARDAAGGCIDTGPVHGWARTFPSEPARAAARAAKHLDDANAEERRRALERLVLLRANERADAVAARLSDDSARVRSAAARALGELGGETHGAALAERLRTERDEAVRYALVGAAARLGGASAGKLLAEALSERAPNEVLVRALGGTLGATGLVPRLVGASATTSSPFLSAWLEASVPPADHGSAATLRIAARAAADAARPEPAPALAALVNDSDADLGRLAQRALARITNREPPRPEDPAAWHQLLTRLRDKPREAWVATGFRDAGYRVPTLEKRHAWELVRALGGSPHHAWNAERTLRALFDHAPKSDDWSATDRCDDWLRWLTKRRAALRLSAPPEATRAACAAR